MLEARSDAVLHQPFWRNAKRNQIQPVVIGAEIERQDNES
jgi:hypothetical protein